MTGGGDGFGKTFLRSVRLTENLLLSLLLGVMIIAAFGRIVMRNLTGGGPAWTDQLLQVLVLWIGLFGALAASRDNKHINIDVVSRFLPPRGAAVTKTLSSLFASAISFALSFYGAKFVLGELGYGGNLLGGNVPAWAVQAVIPVIFGLMGITYTAHFVINLAAVFKKGGEP